MIDLENMTDKERLDQVLNGEGFTDIRVLAEEAQKSIQIIGTVYDAFVEMLVESIECFTERLEDMRNA